MRLQLVELRGFAARGASQKILNRLIPHPHATAHHLTSRDHREGGLMARHQQTSSQRAHRLRGLQQLFEPDFSPRVTRQDEGVKL
ncbi:MAG: hypothetical protein RLZ03_1200 [Pseudomonadota bacterium]